MQCRDKGKWRIMTKFEIRNNMANASQMQFEVLQRALWVQQAQPQTVFNWQFWERAAQDPKMTSYLSHGVKAKMCETSPFVNAVGSHYVASRTQIEQACDSLRQQGSSKVSTIGLSKVDVCASTTGRSLPPAPWLRRCSCLRLLSGAPWSCTSPFNSDILQRVHPHHEVLLSCKPHRPGCHQWKKPLHSQVHDDTKYFQPDVIVEYLDAKYYQCDPEEIYDMGDYNGMQRISLNLIRLSY